ncbi:MAG: endolytic transglycosylase MltG [Methylococcaceae bacterium]|nr:endolytic transglycosylase MltG [Methylococcaceae bacterium]
MIKRLLIALPILAISSILGIDTYKKELHRPLTEQEVVFEIKRGDSLNRVADRLVENNILESPYWFEFSALVEGISNQLKAGEYVARSGITLRGLLDLLVSGAVQQHSLLLVEGWNYRQVLQAVCGHPAIVKTICDRRDLDFTIVFGVPGLHPEGRFFPDTYYLTKGTSDVSVLKRAARKMYTVLKQEWSARSAGLPYKSAYEALILASIIEKETARGEERQEISGVFVRRLEKGMLLQTDPSVIYGLGEGFAGDIRSEDLAADTPYNTYLRPGLPPTPIAIPGIASIRAALHPKPGEYLYFVARGDGSHYFSTTVDEHLRAVNEYQLKKTD